jgi:hypothetical protein
MGRSPIKPVSDQGMDWTYFELRLHFYGPHGPKPDALAFKLFLHQCLQSVFGVVGGGSIHMDLLRFSAETRAALVRLPARYFRQALTARDRTAAAQGWALATAFEGHRCRLETLNCADNLVYFCPDGE